LVTNAGSHRPLPFGGCNFGNPVDEPYDVGPIRFLEKPTDLPKAKTCTQLCGAFVADNVSNQTIFWSILCFNLTSVLLVWHAKAR
jgi:hypothetical protein